MVSRRHEVCTKSKCIIVSIKTIIQILSDFFVIWCQKTQLDKLQWYSLSFSMNSSPVLQSLSLSSSAPSSVLLLPSFQEMTHDSPLTHRRMHTYAHTFGYVQDNLIQCVRLKHQIRSKADDLVGLPVLTQARLVRLKLPEEREVWI